MKEDLKDYYCIPKWCRAHPFFHHDQMGGCWGITGGQVLKNGKKYCEDCEFCDDKKNN